MRLDILLKTEQGYIKVYQKSNDMNDLKQRIIINIIEYYVWKEANT